MRLIDIEPILGAAELAGKEYVSIDFLKGFEQVDAVPVVHGQLIDKGAWHTECGKCGYVFETICMVKNYCPNCGAKMESEGK